MASESKDSAIDTEGNDDDRYETEEFLVYVDMDTKLLDGQLSESNTKIKFLGIDTEHPIMQLNNQVFKGTYEYSMGTHCFFNESNRPSAIEDECFQELPPKLYDFFAKTDKVLKMKRIFVDEKESEPESEVADDEPENFDHLRVTKTYAEALNQFLKSGEQPPREILQDLQESDDAMDADFEEPANLMEPEKLEILNDELDQLRSENPSEESENTKKANIEAKAFEEFERIIAPDNESS